VSAKTFAALGDSMTAGVDDEDTPWPETVARELAAADDPHELVMLARVGAMAADVEREQVPAAIALRPDLLTLACGANDVLLRFQRDLDDCERALRGTATALRDGLPDTRILVVTYARFPDHLPYRPRSAHRIRTGMSTLNEQLRAAAATIGADVVDVEYHPLAAYAENFREDGVHATATGHARIAGAVLGTLSPALMPPTADPATRL
jgi:lysophospholipase L1-like esterase